MTKIEDEFNHNAFTRIGKNEERINQLGLRVDRIEEDTQSIKEIATLVKLQREDSIRLEKKQHDDAIRREQAQALRDVRQEQTTEKLADAINTINTNIVLLNNGQQSITEDLKATGKRLEKLETSGSISIMDWIKGFAYAAFVAALLLYFNLK